MNLSFQVNLAGRFPGLLTSAFFCPEYDRHLAAAVKAGKTMATAYLDPNLNHAFLGGAKSRLSAGGSDRTVAGSVDRVLKVFHHFETNTEQNFWSSNIRYGDATDVRVSEKKEINGDKCNISDVRSVLNSRLVFWWLMSNTHRTRPWCLWLVYQCVRPSAPWHRIYSLLLNWTVCPRCIAADVLSPFLSSSAVHFLHQYLGQTPPKHFAWKHMLLWALQCAFACGWCQPTCLGWSVISNHLMSPTRTERLVPWVTWCKMPETQELRQLVQQNGCFRTACCLWLQGNTGHTNGGQWI